MRLTWRARLVAVAVAGCVTGGCTSASVTPAAVVKAPAPPLSRFVPSGQRVLQVHQFDLDGGPVPEVTVTTVAAQPAAAGTVPAENLLLLAWDKYAHRWFVAYDAAKDSVTGSYEPDAPMTDPLSSSPPQQPLLPPSIGASGITVRELHDQPGGRGDLLFWASLQYADGAAPAIGIVRYNGQTANVAWSLYASQRGTVSVAGASPHQQVAVSAYWQTPVDPHCCPSRRYRFVVARATNPAAGAGYQVISDDRPWLGAFIAGAQPASGENSPARAEVIAVVPGSPAAGVLRPMDIITGIAGTRPKTAPVLLGPAVVDQFAAHHAGDTIRLRIRRDGIPQTVTVKLSSRASPKAQAASFPSPSFLGVGSYTVTPATAQQNNLPLTQGAAISQVVTGSPAEAAGLTAGEVITSLDHLLVRNTTDLSMIINAIPAGTTVPIGYLTPGGTAQTTTVTIGIAPAQDATQILML
jgi:hypothetical protein